MSLISRKSWIAPALAVALAAAAAVSVAQYAVNRQVGPVYGGTSGAGSVRYGYVTPGVPQSSNMLPSEARNANFRSGALPSEIRMNYYSVGPLAPGGVKAYLPTGSPVVIRDQAPIGTFNPSRDAYKPINPVQNSATAANFAPTAATGSVRYSPPAGSSTSSYFYWPQPGANTSAASAATPKLAQPAAGAAAVSPAPLVSPVTPQAVGSVKYANTK